MILIFKSQAILDEIGFTPDIEGGIGPVKIGDTVKAVDGRVAISHPFSEVDLNWLSAYTHGENPTVMIVEQLPADFVLPTME